MAKGAGITKNRLWRGGRISNFLSRLHHFRGHGVHSPFVYSIAREVFMPRAIEPQNSELFDSLKAIGVGDRAATEITNIATRCNLTTLSINNASSRELVVCTQECTDGQVKKLRNQGTAVVILSPYKRRGLSNYLLSQHPNTSIDRYGYLLLLNNNLPKQHFKL